MLSLVMISSIKPVLGCISWDVECDLILFYKEVNMVKDSVMCLVFS